MYYILSLFALSIYLSLSIGWDLIICSSEALSGKFPCIITALFSVSVQFLILHTSYPLLRKIFKLELLGENYSFWSAIYISPACKTKGNPIWKWRILFFYLGRSFFYVFPFFLGALLSCVAGGKDYYYNQWFALAGGFIPAFIRWITSMIYLPKGTYRVFFRV